MPSNQEEILTDIKAHIGRFGGEFGEWCVGTAKDPRSPFFESHRGRPLISAAGSPVASFT